MKNRNLVRLCATVISTGLATLGLSPTASLASETRELSNGAWSVTAGFGSASVTWDLENPSSKVAISSNGVTIATGQGDGNAVFPVAAGESLELALVSSSELNPNQVSNLAEQHKITEGQVEANFESLTMSNISILVPALGFQSDAASAATVPDNSVLRYQTFIPSAYVQAPSGACTDDLQEYRFVGDARTFGPGSADYRTRFDVRINWTDGGSIIRTATVGETVRQRLSGSTWVFHERMTASNSGMILTLNGTQTNQFVSFNMKQDEKNPLCKAFLTLGISFDFNVVIFRNGSYTMTGTAIRVPNHEIYIKDSDNVSWSIVSRRTLTTFDCLNPLLFPFKNCTNSDPIIGVR